MTINLMILGLLILGFIIGWKKGFIRIISCPLGILVGLYLGVNFAGWLGALINTRYDLVAKLNDFFLGKSFIVKIGELAMSLLAPFHGVSRAVTSIVPNSDTSLMEPTRFLAVLFLYLISFIFLLIAAKIIFNLSVYLITKGLDHTFVGVFNRSAGGLAGLVISLVLCGFIIILFTVLLPTTVLGTESNTLGKMSQTINDSVAAGAVKELVGGFFRR
ncbi:MAG: CvpA family protein [Desulfitobacteriaceae bacterium]|nr:CvpA family protein [Desulfitobacteriaceae bacterium]MDD4751698.1 CvpA family protein [Desulfitobacteriaceae bacterium]